MGWNWWVGGVGLVGGWVEGIGFKTNLKVLWTRPLGLAKANFITINTMNSTQSLMGNDYETKSARKLFMKKLFKILKFVLMFSYSQPQLPVSDSGRPAAH